MKLHALDSQKQMAYDYRNVGLGIMGLGDMFFKLGIKYGSEESKDILDKIMYLMFRSAVQASAELAKEKGSFPKYSDKVYDSTIIKNHFNTDEIKQLKTMGLRNCSLLSVAPSGSIGTMLDVTTGIEPAFQISYQRKTQSLHKDQEVSYDVFINSAKEYMELNKTDKLPDYFVTTSEINWKDRVDIQAIAQNHVDTAISSTVNLPHDIPIEEVEQLYLYAWEQGLKGITIYREGCKRGSILSSNKEDKQTEEKIIERGQVIKAPVESDSRTYQFKSGCGNAYVTVTWDENGIINQTFTNKGGSGTCRSNQEAVSRLVSLSLRGGISIDKIIDQLKSVDVCPSYASARAKGKPVSKGASCPHAIAYILERAKKDIAKKFNNVDVKVNVKQEVIPEPKTVVNNFNLCPECKEPLVNEGHCLQCKACGYSKCE
jgi:ribonucleoside-diphosphate reductase alpha chain